MTAITAQRTNPWLVCILPLAVFLGLTSLEPKPPRAEVATVASGWPELGYEHYPAVYACKLVLTAAALWFVFPGIRQMFPLRGIHPLAWLAGVVGGLLWIGLCELDLERTYFPILGLGWLIDAGERSGFNPLVELADQPAWAYAFLLLRFTGLVLVLPVAEELFLRGFAARFVEAPEWTKLEVGQFSWTSAAATTGLAMLAHPAELLAAAVWFSLISVIVWKTRNLWDAVAAHAVTNLLLGLYVVQFGAWRLL